MKTKFPIQPIYKDNKDVYRFIPNRIVGILLENSPLDMNDIARMDFTDQERIQFAQLIGYSIGGFGELSYVDEDSYNLAHKAIGSKESEIELKIKYYESALQELREKLAPIISNLYGIHPDDLFEHVDMD